MGFPIRALRPGLVLAPLLGLLLTPSTASAAAAGAEPPPEALLAELPFLEESEPNRVGVDLAPESYRKRLRVLLDTGAQHSMFSPRAAREAGVSVRRLKRTPYRRSTLLGRDLEFHVDTRSSDQGARMGWEYGLLGGNFLERYVVEIDFPGRVVRFYDPDVYAVPESISAPDEAVLPIQVVGRRPMVELTFNGQTLPVLLDTGSVFGLILSGEVAERAGIRVDPAVEVRAQMILGPLETRLGTVERLEIGPFVLLEAESLERAVETLATAPDVRILRPVGDDRWVEHDLGAPAGQRQPSAEPGDPGGTAAAGPGGPSGQEGAAAREPGEAVSGHTEERASTP